MSAARPMRLATPAADERNIQLQIHGIKSYQLPWFGALLSSHNAQGGFFRHPALDGEHFRPAPNCNDEPGIGAAGSLRGLHFLCQVIHQRPCSCAPRGLAHRPFNSPFPP